CPHKASPKPGEYFANDDRKNPPKPSRNWGDPGNYEVCQATRAAAAAIKIPPHPLLFRNSGTSRRRGHERAIQDIYLAVQVMRDLLRVYRPAADRSRCVTERLLRAIASYCWSWIQDSPRVLRWNELKLASISFYPQVQWADNDGRCGVCGDSYSEARPRRHETGSSLDPNVTVRTYAPGEDVVIIVDVVANHLGYFEFGLCPRNDSGIRETEDCFQRLRVKSLNTSEVLVEEGDMRYRLASDRKGFFYLVATLPKDVTCSRCILRWHW
ncbi:hypothetical protein BIW11_08731, partial [Tropilaelaps mercedesae]